MRRSAFSLEIYIVISRRMKWAIGWIATRNKMSSNNSTNTLLQSPRHSCIAMVEHDWSLTMALLWVELVLLCQCDCFMSAMEATFANWFLNCLLHKGLTPSHWLSVRERAHSLTNLATWFSHTSSSEPRQHWNYLLPKPRLNIKPIGHIEMFSLGSISGYKFVQFACIHLLHSN